MNRLVKLLLIILTLIFALSSFIGCATVYKITAPKEYKQIAFEAEDYPKDTLPIFYDSVIYDYEYDEDDNTISIKYGSENDLDDISEFYMDYFEGNDVFLSTEKDRSKTYLADGELGNYEFELTVEEPSGKWEKRLYASIVEIEIQKLNIPNKNQLLLFIEHVEKNHESYMSIYDTYFMLENNEEDDNDYFIEETDKALSILYAIKDEMEKVDINNILPIKDLYYTNIEMADLLIAVFKDYNENSIYNKDFLDAMEEYDEFSDTSFDYWDDEFKALIPAYEAFTNKLENMSAPSFVDDFHVSLIDILMETTKTAQYCIDAINNNDNVLFYAGLQSYDINFRDLLELVEFYTTDIEIKSEREVKEVEKVKKAYDGIKEWIEIAKEDIESDAVEITSIPKEHLLHTAKTELKCDYLYPNEIIPANYRSLDYIAFVQLYTNKGATTAKLTVEIPGFTQKFEQKIEISQSETEIKVRPPLSTNAIKNLNSSKDAQLIITVEDLNTSELVVQDTIEITLYSRYDMQWYDEYDNSYIENILAWMTPEADEISTLLRASADSAEYLSDGELDSIVGYQRVSDWSEAYITYIQVASIMHALAKEMDVKYIAEPFSATSTALQRVKTPEQVINEKGGLCAETALTIASALQAIGMHPVLIFPPGHVMVAVETWRGSGEYLLIETTALTSAANEDFDNVIVFPDSDGWDEYLSQDDYIVIDCALADDYGIKSID